MATREFRFSEGTSNKFWKISLDGTGFTVQFGRAGTAGQTQTKEFDSETAAAQAAEKLINEKLRKGYVEQLGDGTQPALALAPAKPAPAPVAKVTQAPAAPGAEAAPTTPSEPNAFVTLDPDQLRSLDLEPGDWARVVYQRVPLPRPAPPAFNPEEAQARLKKAVRESYYWGSQWERARIAPALGAAEARFWMDSMAGRLDQRLSQQRQYGHKAAERATGFRGDLEAAGSQQTPEAIKPLASLIRSDWLSPR